MPTQIIKPSKVRRAEIKKDMDALMPEFERRLVSLEHYCTLLEDRVDELEFFIDAVEDWGVSSQ